MSELQVNTDLFSAGGVMGRKDYFFSCLKIGGMSILSYAIPFAAALVPNDVGSYAGLGIYAIANFGLAYFAYLNMYKRVRDIRGTIEKQTLPQVFFTVFSIIPVINIFTACILFFKQGKVTSPVQYPPQDAPVDYNQAA